MTWKMPNEICLTKILIKNDIDNVLKLYSNSFYNIAH